MVAHAQVFAMAERCLLDSRTQAAVFFAEMAFLEASENADTQLLYARALFANKDLQRLVTRFKASEIRDVRDLVARALLGLDEGDQLEEYVKGGAAGRLPSSTMHYVLGKAAQKRQNVETARENFRLALLKEELNYEAAAALFGSGLLTEKEEAEYPSAFSVFFSAQKTNIDVIPTMQNLSDFRVVQAKRKFQNRDFRGALAAVKPLFENSDCFLPAVEIYAGTLLALNETSELYYFAHRAMRQYPDDGRSWLVAGLYYMGVNKMEQARKFLSKAFSLSHNSLSICLAYGHAFSASDEAEQALSVYRTGHRLFPGSYLPLLYLARECIRASNVALAEKYLWSGMDVATTATAQAELLYELGVCAYHSKSHSKACELFLRAIDVLEKENQPISGNLWANLGFALVKKRELAEAEKAFTKAVSADRKNADAHLGLGFVRHLSGSFDAAIDAYNEVLKFGPARSLGVAKTLITSAMAEKLGHKLEIPITSRP